MKRLFITICLIVAFAFISQAQTLKITDVASTNDKMYKNVSEQALGKTMTLTFYDNAVKVSVQGTKPVILKKERENSYFAITEENKAETWTAQLKPNTTFGVLTSAILIIEVTPKGDFGFNRTVTCTVTAKRF